MQTKNLFYKLVKHLKQYGNCDREYYVSLLSREVLVALKINIQNRHFI